MRTIVLLNVIVVYHCHSLPSYAQFRTPETIGLVGGQDADWAPTISSDLLEAYFVSWRSSGDADIWSARRDHPDASWEDLQPVEIVNSSRWETGPALSPDGLTLTFASNGLDGGFGGMDLWQTTRESRHEEWLEPFNLGPFVNSSGDEASPTLSPDGLEIIYDRWGNPPATLRRSTRMSPSDPWSEPEIMSRVQRGDEFGLAAYPSLSPDGLSLYFNATGRHGRYDVFVARRPSLEAPFGRRENLGELINTPGDDVAPRIASDGSLYYARNVEFGVFPWEVWRAEAENPIIPEVPKTLRAGDADQDLDFDQLDLIRVAQAGKYLSDQPATWGEGDWDGAPGGEVGNPPAGNGLFDQLDIIAALAPGHYLTGPYGALAGSKIHPDGIADAQTSIVYNANTGEVSVDAPTGTNLTSVNIDSASGMFANHEASQNLDGSFDTRSNTNIFKATFGNSFGSLTFGEVAQAGLAKDFVANDLSVVGSLEGGGGLGNVDLVYIPEPSTILLLAMGMSLCLGLRRA